MFVLLLPNPGPCIICPKTITSALGSTTFEIQKSQKVDISSELDNHRLYQQRIFRALPPPPFLLLHAPPILQLIRAHPCSPHLPALLSTTCLSAHSHAGGRLLPGLSHLLGSMLDLLDQAIRDLVPTILIKRKKKFLQ